MTDVTWVPINKITRVNLWVGYFKEKDLLVIKDEQEGLTLELKDLSFTDETLKTLGNIVLRDIKKQFSKELGND